MSENILSSLPAIFFSVKTGASERKNTVDDGIQMARKGFVNVLTLGNVCFKRRTIKLSTVRSIEKTILHRVLLHHNSVREHIDETSFVRLPREIILYEFWTIQASLCLFSGKIESFL